MITKSKLKEWVDALPDGSVVGVGGCSLELVAQAPDSKGWEDMLEVGDLPAIEG